MWEQPGVHLRFFKLLSVGCTDSLIKQNTASKECVQHGRKAVGGKRQWHWNALTYSHHGYIYCHLFYKKRRMGPLMVWPPAASSSCKLISKKILEERSLKLANGIFNIFSHKFCSKEAPLKLFFSKLVCFSTNFYILAKNRLGVNTNSLSKLSVCMSVHLPLLPFFCNLHHSPHFRCVLDCILLY